jgi:hypothetical protein
VESWFELWTGPTRATLGRPVTIAVQVAETDQPTTFEENGQTVTARITLPAALLRDGVEAVPFDLRTASSPPWRPAASGGYPSHSSS